MCLMIPPIVVMLLMLHLLPEIQDSSICFLTSKSWITLSNTTQVPLQIVYRHQNLFHYFPALTQALESLFVLEGIKPVSQQLIHEPDLHQIKGFCQNMGLGFASTSTGGSWHLAMLSHNQETADHALFYAAIGNHQRLGETLGYPPCCVRNYLGNVKKVASEAEYGLLGSLRNHEVPFVMNYLLRSADVSILSHIPCSFDCSSSLHLAEKAYACVQKHHPQLAQYLKQHLSGPIVLHDQGVHPLRGYSRVDDRIYYTNAEQLKESAMNAVFSRCDNVHLVGKNHLQLCQKNHVVDELKDNVRFLLFS